MNAVAPEPNVRAGARTLLAYDALLVLALALRPPSAAQLAHADPLVRLLAAGPGLWAAPVLCAVPAILWRSPAPAPARSSIQLAAAGAALAAAGVVTLRLFFGPQLPRFVPAEESAAPGMALGLAAGLLEEAVFRMLLLAPLLRSLRSFGWRPWLADAGAVLLAALGFAAAHEIGPEPFQLSLFLTRLLLPGLGMGFLFVCIGPAFLVSLHGAAHLLIPLLLPGAL